MSESEISKKVIGIIAERLNKDADKITRESKFYEDLGADSLDIVELIMLFEDEFGTKTPDDEYELLTTVGSVIDYVERKVAEEKGNQA